MKFAEVILYGDNQKRILAVEDPIMYKFLENTAVEFKRIKPPKKGSKVPLYTCNQRDILKGTAKKVEV